jgi:hypothetical protein
MSMEYSVLAVFVYRDKLKTHAVQSEDPTRE